MGIPRTLPAVTVYQTDGPTPAYTGTVIPAVSVALAKGIATIVLNVSGLTPAAFPTNGYNGPNGYPVKNLATGAPIDIQGKYPAANGQQVTLWGFTTTLGQTFNGRTVTVLDCNPDSNSFRFYWTPDTNDHVPEADAGNTAACPFEHYRVVRIEVDQANGTDFVYVGDLNVSSSRYVAALSLAGQIAIEIASENIPADRIWMIATNSSATDSVHISLIF